MKRHNVLTSFFLCSIYILGAQTLSLELKSGSENPLDGFSTGLDFNPAAVDIDNDGDLDIFSGSYFGDYSFFRNDGTNISPSFSDQTETSNNPFQNMQVGNRSRMEFVDLDNDGDFDMFFGDNGGYIKYRENTGTASAPVFSSTVTNSNYFSRDFGVHANIEFVDIDNDNDFDAFVSSGDSNIYYYENTGTVTVPVWTERTGSLNPLNGASTNTYLYGDFADMDNDGDLDFYTGSFEGFVFYYLNTGTVTAPVFVLQSGSNNLLSDISIGSNGRLDVGLVDINGDNVIDAFVGKRAGGTVSYYEGSSVVLGISKVEDENIKLYPNPVSDILHIESKSLDGSMRIYDVTGKEVLSMNIAKQIDLRILNKGVYFVEIFEGNSSVTHKLIKN